MEMAGSLRGSPKPFWRQVSNTVPVFSVLLGVVVWLFGKTAGKEGNMAYFSVEWISGFCYRASRLFQLMEF